MELLNSVDGRSSALVQRKPWLVAMVFGLVHGLGFASALSEYGLPIYAKLVSLFAFNLGVEIGQLVFVALVLIALGLLQRLAKPSQQMIFRTSTYFIGVCGAFWMIERVAGFYG